jgi:hypothetical protein
VERTAYAAKFRKAPSEVLPKCRKNSNGSNGSAPSGALGKIGGFYRQ